MNGKPLLPIDPGNVITPILHCSMGLVEKVFESLLWWIFICCIKVNQPELNTQRMLYRRYKKDLKTRQKELDEEMQKEEEDTDRIEEIKELIKFSRARITEANQLLTKELNR